MRVLVVDDDPTIRDMLRLVLELEGFEVRVADDGAVGLLALREWTSDVVVVDVAMPEVDGWGLVRQLRGDPGLRGLPVVFCTALTDDESTWQGWRLGAASYVAKPFNPDDLVGEVVLAAAERDMVRFLDDADAGR